MKNLRMIPAILVAVLLLIAACESDDPNGSNPLNPDSTDVPGDTTNPPDTAVIINSSGLTPEDIQCDMFAMQMRYFPLQYEIQWVLRETLVGAENIVRYQYRLGSLGRGGDYGSISIYQDDELRPTGWEAESTSQGYSYDPYCIHLYDDQPVYWSFYCFCAAEAGDTIRYYLHQEDEDTLRYELVRVIGWDETVELQDTTFTGCYVVETDTIRTIDGNRFHRSIRESFMPDLGLVQRVERLEEEGSTTTTTLEYIPASAWPWWCELRLEPGPVGEEVQEYFPLGEGYEWDYLQTFEFGSDTTLYRQQCLAPEFENGFPVYELARYYSEDYHDTTNFEELSSQFWSYNGNFPVARRTEWEADISFNHFPNGLPGQFVYSNRFAIHHYAPDRTAEVVDIGLTVTVPAGTFDDVIELRYLETWGEMEGYHGNEYYRWYAPGVGLIKQVSTSLTAFSSMSTYRELVRFRDGGSR